MNLDAWNETWTRAKDAALAEHDLRCPKCSAPLQHFVGPVAEKQDWICTHCNGTGPVRRLPRVEPFDEAAGYEGERDMDYERHLATCYEGEEGEL